MIHANRQSLQQGAIVIPEPLRLPHNWYPGQKLQVIDMEDGILLNTAQPFPETTLEQVAVCLPYHDKTKALTEMDAAIRHGTEENTRDRD
jgi:bifunctional DNA-binding transcriptional regulator/antitoxin component of YhaV-PrlF toxin-antitoxin module